MKSIRLNEGECIKHFRILDYIGSGREGSCYLCLDKSDNKKKTIKFYKISEELTKFNIYEIKDAFLILNRYKGIVRFYQNGEFTFHKIKYIFFILEYIEGLPLKKLYESKRQENSWKIEHAIKVIYQLSEILYSDRERILFTLLRNSDRQLAKLIFPPRPSARENSSEIS